MADLEKENQLRNDYIVQRTVVEQYNQSAIKALQFHQLFEIFEQIGYGKIPAAKVKHIPIMNRLRCDSVEDIKNKSSYLSFFL